MERDAIARSTVGHEDDDEEEEFGFDGCAWEVEHQRA